MDTDSIYNAEEFVLLKQSGVEMSWIWLGMIWRCWLPKDLLGLLLSIAICFACREGK